MIEFQDVTKVYRSPLRRAIRAVEGFSLSVAPGEVLGLAGPNGAGKSTLIALLLGYLRPTSGRVSIDGRPPRDHIERHGIGYLSELVAIPPNWNVQTALVRYGTLAGVPARELPARIDALIALLGLEEHRAKKVRQLSKGNLQRLGLAQALLREETVIILDEPTHGLDPVWTQRFRDVVRDLRRPDRVMLIASHNLDELERVADRVAIIDRGRLQRVVEIRRLGAAAPALRYRLALAAGPEHVPALFPGARELGAGEYDVVVDGVRTLNGALAELLARGALITAVTPAYSALERQFREAVGEQGT